MADEQPPDYGSEPVFVLTLMRQGWTLDEAKTLVFLGHVPTQEEVIDWFHSEDWIEAPPIPLLDVLFAAKLIEQRHRNGGNPIPGNWLQ